MIVSKDSNLRSISFLMYLRTYCRDALLCIALVKSETCLYQLPTPLLSPKWTRVKLIKVQSTLLLPLLDLFPPTGGQDRHRRLTPM